MTNAFTKHNDAWVIKADRADLAGQDIIVTTRAGAQKNVTLAQYLGPTQGGRFDGHLYAIAERAPAAAAQEVGDLSRIMQLFASAAAAQPNRRRPPAIVFADFRINVAGERAREPGSLTITSSTERDDRGMRKWLGRITRAGMFEPARSTPAAIGDRLRAFAADPAAVAAQHGQVTKSCCFCNKNLTDPRSRTVGYGPDCADNFGLPWGAISDGETPARAVAAMLAHDDAHPRDLGTARGTAQSRARRANREFAQRNYNHQENDPLDHDYSMNG